MSRGLSCVVQVSILLSGLTLVSTLICLNCPKVADVQNCLSAKKCETHQKCSAFQYQDGNGRLWYSLGCADTQTCDHSLPMMIGKRDPDRSDAINLSAGTENEIVDKEIRLADSAVCSQCCNDTDGCNKNLCGTTTTTNLRCLVCKDSLEPAYCDQFTVCGRDEMCLVQRRSDPFTLNPRYQMSCVGFQQCKSLQKTSPDNCVVCCNSSDFCNYDACDNWSSTPAQTTYPATSIPTTVIPTTATDYSTVTSDSQKATVIATTVKPTTATDYSTVTSNSQKSTGITTTVKPTTATDYLTKTTLSQEPATEGYTSTRNVQVGSTQSPVSTPHGHNMTTVSSTKPTSTLTLSSTQTTGQILTNSHNQTASSTPVFNSNNFTTIHLLSTDFFSSPTAASKTPATTTSVTSTTEVVSATTIVHKNTAKHSSTIPTTQIVSSKGTIISSQIPTATSTYQSSKQTSASTFKSTQNTTPKSTPLDTETTTHKTTSTAAATTVSSAHTTGSTTIVFNTPVREQTTEVQITHVNPATSQPTTITAYSLVINAPDRGSYLSKQELKCVSVPAAEAYIWKFNASLRLPEGVMQENGISISAGLAGLDKLVISKLNDTTVGTYTCLAVIKGQLLEKSHFIGITKEAPTVAIIKPVITSNFALLCHFSGYPPPQIGWAFVQKGVNTPTVNLPKDVVVSSKDDVSILLVPLYRPQAHDGTWYCAATNSIGSTVESVDVP